MPETLAALLFAHSLAEFLFQSKAMTSRRPRLAAFGPHTALVLGLGVAALGQISLPLIFLAVLHTGIDLVKSATRQHGPLPFLIAQNAHLASLIALASLDPGLWAHGVWADFPALAALMAVVAGFIAATRAGGQVIALLMARWEADAGAGLQGGGSAIGLLERALIFLMVLTGAPEGIGFLIAAKSILRFGTVKDDRRVSEYVIIGTLASFGWAILWASATAALLDLLPPLGIFVPTP